MKLYQCFKPTEVGVIPEDWLIKSLEESTDPSRPISYGIVQTGKNLSEGIPCLRVVDIHEGKIRKEHLIRTSEEISNAYRRTVLKSGDVVMPLRGKVGDVGMVDDELQGANLTRGVALLAVLPSLSGAYIYQFVSWSRTRRRLEQAMNGSALQEIPIATLRSFKVAMPSTQREQQEIATALSDVDALLDGLDRLIAKKRDIKQAAMQQLLTGKTRLPGFEGEWEVKNLGDEASFFKGKGLPKSALTPYGSEPCVHYGELFTKYSEEITETISNTSYLPDHFLSVANDVLMPTSDVTPTGLAKASCVTSNDVVLGGDILVIRTNPERIFGVFLSYVIRREETQILRLVTGTTVFHLYGTDMAKFVFSFPSVEEQKAIVAVLSDMDAEIEALKNRRNKTRELKQAMMQELLTGRTRLVDSEELKVESESEHG